MGWGLGSTIKASERRTLFRRRLAVRVRDHGGCLLLAGVDRSLHCSAERIWQRNDSSRGELSQRVWGASPLGTKVR